jgi:hypothetical protein
MLAVFSLSLYSLRQSLEAIGRFNRKEMLLRFPLCARRKDSLGAVSVKILSNHRLFCLHVKSNGIFDLISSFIARINVKTKTERQLLCFVGKRDVKQIPLAFSNVKQCDINIRENKTSP